MPNSNFRDFHHMNFLKTTPRLDKNQKNNFHQWQPCVAHDVTLQRHKEIRREKERLDPHTGAERLIIPEALPEDHVHAEAEEEQVADLPGQLGCPHHPPERGHAVRNGQWHCCHPAASYSDFIAIESSSEWGNQPKAAAVEEPKEWAGVVHRWL